MTAADVRRQTVRSLAWIGFAAIAAVRAALMIASLDASSETLFSDVLTYLLPVALTTTLLYVLTLKTFGLAEHRLWGMLAIASTLVLFAEVHFTWYAYVIDHHGPDIASPMQLLHLAAAVMFFVGIASVARFSEQPRIVRVRLLLDVCAVGCTVGALTFAFLSGPALIGLPGGGLDAALVVAVYPVAGLCLLASALLAFVGWRPSRMRAWERLMAGALSLFALGLIVMPLWYPALLAAEESGPTWMTTVLGAAYWLLAVAAVYRLTASRSEGISDPWAAASGAPRWAQWLLPIALMLLVPILGIGAIQTAGSATWHVLVIAAAAVAVLLVVRSSVSSLIAAGYEGATRSAGGSLVVHRTVFDAQLGAAIMIAESAQTPLSLVVFTVAQRVRYDTALGHSISEDDAARLRDTIAAALGESSSVDWIRADRIGVICPGAGGHEAASRARRAWLKIRSEGGGDEAAPRVSAGIAVYPEHGTTAEALLASAQTACLRAAGSDAEPVEVYSSADEETSRAELVERARTRTLRETIRALAQAVDGRSPVTAGHSENVAELATALAQVLDLSDSRVQIVGLAALMHDVGKVGVSDSIVTKGGELSVEERILFEEHPVLGSRILEQAGLAELLPVVRHHHERWDGSGYPDGLAGSQIPLEARILAVSDEFEGLTAGRAAEKPLSADDALAVIRDGAGRQHDPVVAGAFVRMIERLHTTTAATSVT